MNRWVGLTLTVQRHTSGQRLTRHQILRIVEMPIPGEETLENSRIWTQGTVSVVDAPLEEVIWRYMPLEQLLALLLRKALHFSSLSVMGDATEGQLPLRAWEETKKQLPQSILEGSGGIDADLMTAIMIQQRRTDACICCWYMNASDSLKMWQQYAPRNGVAIQSTVRRLASCFIEFQTPIRIIPVKYFEADEEDEYTSDAFWGSLFIKHGCYRHERELRALAYRTNAGNGVDETVNLDTLIERVVLSPELRDWAVLVMTETIRRLDFAGPVVKSAMSVPR